MTPYDSDFVRLYPPMPVQKSRVVIWGLPDHRPLITRYDRAKKDRAANSPVESNREASRPNQTQGAGQGRRVQTDKDPVAPKGAR